MSAGDRDLAPCTPGHRDSQDRACEMPLPWGCPAPHPCSLQPPESAPPTHSADGETEAQGRQRDFQVPSLMFFQACCRRRARMGVGASPRRSPNLTVLSPPPGSL